MRRTAKTLRVSSARVQGVSGIHMITLCHAMNDMEVMYIRAMLQSSEIPFHIVGENFGSLYPGMQIASYNERRFLVPQEYLEEAIELIQALRAEEPTSKEAIVQEDLTIGSKIRIVLETLLFGWSSLGGKKTTNKFKNEDVASDSDASSTRPF